MLLAQPRGFCAGVEMAIKALSWMVRVFEPPVYCYHEIVHNRLVVDRFRELGVVFVDDIDDVPAGAPLMLSAHGSAPEVVPRPGTKDRFVVNAVCPLVTKVHHEAKVRAGKGFTVLYVGHARPRRGHRHPRGRARRHPAGRARGRPRRGAARRSATPPRSRSSRRPRSSHPRLGGRSRTAPAAASPSCGPRPATTCASPPPTARRRCRRSRREADAVVVIGSANSSNTLALAKVATAAGCPTVLRVDGPDELDADALGDARVVGVTAGASAPEDLVQAVIARLAPTDGVVPVHVTDEDEYFPPPRELRELMATLDVAAPVLLGGAAPDAAPRRRVHRRPPRSTRPDVARAADVGLAARQPLGVVEAALQLDAAAPR